ncbi:MAG: hypothetical protein U0793_22780 [Gemmataceae bacterium]
MKSKRLLLGVALLAVTLLAAWFLLLGSGMWEGAASGRVKSVPAGHQEVAWIAPATGSDSWERLVASLNVLVAEWEKQHGGPTFTLDLTNAFLHTTASIPEIGLRFGGPEQTLWIRWYKLSGENTPATWIDRLAARDTPPLAIIGGESTDRALAIAKALEAARPRWKGAAPLFLITTATAHRISPGEDRSHAVPPREWPLLMNVYRGRSFRYSFTNTRMVEALFDFLQENPHVCPARSSDPAQFAGMVAQGDPLGCLATLSATGHTQPWFLFGVSWMDDGYSRDMVSIALHQFREQMVNSELGFFDETQVPYSAGGYQQVNASEARAVGALIASGSVRENSNFILVLPTGAQRVRRFVADFARQAPLETRRFVVVSGDSVSFNTVFRDRDTAWNILDVQTPLVFFTHRLPTSKAAGFHWQATDKEPGARSGTEDLLLDRDIMESLLLAAFDGGKLLSDADQVARRLRRSVWLKGRIHKHPEGADEGIPLFTEEGDRSSGTGEHIVWVQPLFDKGGRILQRANISIWGVNAKDIHRWFIRPEIAPPLSVSYNDTGKVLVYHRFEDWFRFSTVHRELLLDPNEMREKGVEELHD